MRSAYARYLAAATAARLADAMWVAVLLLVLERTDDHALAGLALGCATLPAMVSAPLIGAWLDRTSRRRAALAVNQVVLAGGLAVVLVSAGRGPDWVMLLAACCAGVTQPLVTGGFTSLLPGMLSGAALTRANAAESATYNIADVVGPSLAGVLAAAAGAEVAVGAQIAIALLGLALLPGLPVGPRPDGPASRAGHAAARSIAADAWEGVRVLVRIPALRAVTVTSVVASGGLGVIQLALPAFAEDRTGDAGLAGPLWAGAAVGCIAGASLLPRLARRFPPTRLVLCAAASQAVLIAYVGLLPNVAVAAAALFVFGLPTGLSFAAVLQVRADESPPALRGRVFTSAAGLKVGAYAIGAAVSGALVEQLGAAWTFDAAGLVYATAAALALALTASRYGPAPWHGRSAQRTAPSGASGGSGSPGGASSATSCPTSAPSPTSAASTSSRS